MREEMYYNLMLPIQGLGLRTNFVMSGVRRKIQMSRFKLKSPSNTKPNQTFGYIHKENTIENRCYVRYSNNGNAICYV